MLRMTWHSVLFEFWNPARYIFTIFVIIGAKHIPEDGLFDENDQDVKGKNEQEKIDHQDP